MSRDQQPPIAAELADRVLAACRAQRQPGRATPLPPAISPVEALSRAADAFGGVLCALDDAGWHVPALRDLDVQGLVGHLIGVEADFQRSLAGEDGPGDAEHVAATQSSALNQAGRPATETYREWRSAVDRTIAAVPGADLAAPLPLHRLRLPLGALLVARAFELWAHENDVRGATGMPPSAPDDSTLVLMTGLAAELLPAAAAYARVPSCDLHLVLTGAGGGTWDLRFGRSSEAPAGAGELEIVADAVAFCRLAANRLAPAELDAHVSGDRRLVDRVLAATASLALD